MTKPGRRGYGRAAQWVVELRRTVAIAAALTVVGAIDLPRLPWAGIDLGAAPAFAKNDRSSERGRSDRGRGFERRLARSDAQDSDSGRRVGNRPRHRDHADNGRHLGHLRSGVADAAFERRNTATMLAGPPLPPRRPDLDESTFRNHGDRVSAFVALSKSLGLSARTGAMQANFGTPFENGLVATDPDTGEFLKDPDSGEFIIDATAAEIAAVKPGNGPKTGWETETGLDVNMDGIVDATDLDLALAGGAVPMDGGTPVDHEDGGDDAATAILRIGREIGASTP